MSVWFDHERRVINNVVRGGIPVTLWAAEPSVGMGSQGKWSVRWNRVVVYHDEGSMEGIVFRYFWDGDTDLRIRNQVYLAVLNAHQRREDIEREVAKLAVLGHDMRTGMILSVTGKDAVGERVKDKQRIEVWAR